jgi:hypothetical protein
MLLSEEKVTSEIDLGTDERINKIPSFTRSSIVNISQRESRGKRDLREYLSNVNDSQLMHVLTNKNTVLNYLLENSQREKSDGESKSSAYRFMFSQTPLTSNIYKINSVLYESILGKITSKSSIFELSKNWKDEINSEEFEDHYLINNKRIQKLKEFSLGDKFESAEKLLIGYLSSIRITKIVPIRRITKMRLDQREYLDKISQELLIERLLVPITPMILGGSSNSSMLSYIENKLAIESKIRKFCFRRQKFKLALLDGDNGDNILQAILKSNLIEGSKAEYESARINYQYSPDIDFMQLMNFLNSDQKYYVSGHKRTAQLHLPITKPYGILDITYVVNNLIVNTGMFYGKQSKVNVMLSLFSFSKNYPFIPLVITRDDLKLSLETKSYKTETSNFEMSYRPVLDSKGYLLYSDFLEKNGNKYRHDILSKEMIGIGKDNPVDKYNLMVPKKNIINVHLTEHLGFILLNTKLNEDNIYERVSIDKYFPPVKKKQKEIDNSLEDFRICCLGLSASPMLGESMIQCGKTSRLFIIEDVNKVVDLLSEYPGEVMFVNRFDFLEVDLTDESKLVENCNIDDQLDIGDLENYDSDDGIEIDFDIFEGSEDTEVKGSHKHITRNSSDSDASSYSDSEFSSEITFTKTFVPYEKETIWTDTIKSSAGKVDYYKKIPDKNMVIFRLKLPKELENVYETDNSLTAMGKLLENVNMIENDDKRFWALSIIYDFFQRFKDEGSLR